MKDQKVEVNMKPPHPGVFIKQEILDDLGITISKAAKVLRVRRATLNDLVNKKSGLSAEMAVRIELAFGVKAVMLSKMQFWYDIEEAKKRVSSLGIVPFQ